jgi:hypothetical protein
VDGLIDTMCLYYPSYMRGNGRVEGTSYELKKKQYSKYNSYLDDM